MSERETGMRREEIAVWLEEMAGQLRTGALMVEGESLAVPEEPRTRVKSKSKKGSRRLKLELEWPEEEGLPKGKGGKKGKKQPASQNGAPSGVPTDAPQTSCNGGFQNGCGGHARNDVSGTGPSRRGSVRDYDSHVLVCKGGDCCKKGGKETKKALKSELRAAGMNGDVRVDSVECLGLCKQGPNVIVYPEGSWYLGLKERDVPEVVEEHLKGGEPVERLAAERRQRKNGKKSKKARS